jgi:hypothetical protein
MRNSLLRLIRVIVTGKVPDAPSCCECLTCNIVRGRNEETK